MQEQFFLVLFIIIIFAIVFHHFFPTSYLPLYSLYYAVVCEELVGSISTLLHSGSTAGPSEEMSQWLQDFGNSMSDLTDPRFKPQTSYSRKERVTTR